MGWEVKGGVVIEVGIFCVGEYIFLRFYFLFPIRVDLFDVNLCGKDHNENR
jgi:hypothetical protein